MAEDKGDVVCAFCKEKAAVRENSKGKLYYNCRDCGIVQPHGRRFQLWLMDNAFMYGPDGKPEEPIAPDPVSPPKPVPVIEEKPIVASPTPVPVTKKKLLDYL